MIVINKFVKEGLELWGLLFLIFIGLWLMQVWLTARQVKHYRQTVHQMSAYESGFLGVGVEKKRFGKGTVMIIVSNNVGEIIDCKVMSGVTVFSKFDKCKRFIGLPISEVPETIQEDYANAFQMAIEKIREQMGQSRITEMTN